MSNKNGHHIVKYKTYFFVLLALLVFTTLSILVTSVELGPVAVFAALLFASLKSSLVLIYFMHLRFDSRVYSIMVGLVLCVFVAVIVITFFDYIFR